MERVASRRCAVGSLDIDGRRQCSDERVDRTMGCRVLTQPAFLAARPLAAGAGELRSKHRSGPDLSTDEVDGRALWEAVGNASPPRRMQVLSPKPLVTARRRWSSRVLGKGLSASRHGQLDRRCA
jgi:hypothetical protein